MFFVFLQLLCSQNIMCVSDVRGVLSCGFSSREKSMRLILRGVLKRANMLLFWKYIFLCQEVYLDLKIGFKNHGHFIPTIYSQKKEEENLKLKQIGINKINFSPTN